MCRHRISWFFDQKHWVYIWWEPPARQPTEKHRHTEHTNTHTHTQREQRQCERWILKFGIQSVRWHLNGNDKDRNSHSLDGLISLRANDFWLCMEFQKISLWWTADEFYRLSTFLIIIWTLSHVKWTLFFLASANSVELLNEIVWHDPLTLNCSEG